MIVGTIALLALLFGGGTGELFFVDKFEKGIKEYVIDKDRKKDILVDLKTSKAFIKEFNKERDTDLNSFYELNSSWTTSSEDMVVFFNEMQEKRIEFQNTMIDHRVQISEKITAEEWVSIVDFSEDATDERIAKENKKLDKAEDKGKTSTVFEKTKNSIAENVSDSEKQEIIIVGLDDLIKTFGKLGNEIGSINVKSDNILVRKDASKEELKEMVEEMNVLRNLSFNQLLNFHMLVRENSTETVFEPIMKAFNKELAITGK